MLMLPCLCLKMNFREYGNNPICAPRRPGELVEEREEGKATACLQHWKGVLPGKGPTGGERQTGKGLSALEHPL